MHEKGREKDRGNDLFCSKTAVCKAEGVYLHVFYFICMRLISGWVVSGFSAGNPLNEIVSA